MNKFPDFSLHGYQVERELGHNRTCGRVTYLATSTNTQSTVVIKQFQFAQLGANWSDYDTIDREIQLLRQLNHASIPRYLDSFQTPTGFCLVQEYKQAASLAHPHLFKLEEIKEIAIAVLEVLVYLQQQIPPIIHRDIKPENILVDRQDKLKVYLVDFGFARSGSGEVAVSSVVKGTLGFMPPEQLFNRQVTEASDLYSLGATLICLLTQTKSSEIGNLIDESYRFEFQDLVPNLSREFIVWLEKMVAPNLNHRFQNAADALEALKQIEIGKGKQNPKNKSGLRSLVAMSSILALLSVSFTILSQIAAENSRIRAQNWVLQDQVSNRRLSLVELLRKTRQCPECYLADADLGGAKLKGANLQRAILQAAYLEEANLQRANLRGANLWNANLKNANLSRANLGYAYLNSANLEGADLRSANLWGAEMGDYVNLRNANLRGVNLGNANLTGTYLGNADLKNANLWGADLSGAFLGNANLAGAKLADSDLTSANLADADLENAKLSGAKLSDAKLLGAYMEGVDLSDAFLENADLRGANLKGANLRGANLNGANLRGANLNGANLDGVNLRGVNLKGATMPDGSIYK